MRPLDRFLNELIDFGGIPRARAEAIGIMQTEGHPQPVIDGWLQGQEFAAQCRVGQRSISTRILVS